MPKKKEDEIPVDPTLAEILQGVDIVGTIVDQELPRLRADLEDVKRMLSSVAHPAPDADLVAALGEIRELLEAQERRLLQIDLRLARMEGAASPPHE